MNFIVSVCFRWSTLIRVEQIFHSNYNYETDHVHFKVNNIVLGIMTLSVQIEAGQIPKHLVINTGTKGWRIDKVRARGYSRPRDKRREVYYQSSSLEVLSLFKMSQLLRAFSSDCNYFALLIRIQTTVITRQRWSWLYSVHTNSAIHIRICTHSSSIASWELSRHSKANENPILSKVYNFFDKPTQS